MKNILIFLLAIIFLSCNNKKFYKDFYENGNVKLKIEIDENEIKNGKFFEYYNDGELKAIGKYINGNVEDSAFIYYENGKLREKGFFKNGYKNGWFFIYRENGKIMKKEEFIKINNKYLKNQYIFFDENGTINYSKSSFFELNIPDTIKLGKNKLTLKYHDNSTKADYNFLNVIIKNKYSENETKNDTFTDGTRNPFFGVFAYKKGEMIINGIIEEKILEQKNIGRDSASLTITDKYKFFNKKVYVTDK
jgi:hypothetical protein